MIDIKTVKGLPFSGKAKDFKVWHFRFLAYSNMHKCRSILDDDTIVAPAASEVLDKINDAHIDKLDYRQQNSNAYTLLALSVVDPISYEAVRNATTEDLPFGDAKAAMKNLIKIYKPVTRTEMHALEHQFHHCQLLEDNSNPDKWFAKFDNLRLQLKLDHSVNISDAKMITKILYSEKPKLYDTIITMMKREINNGVKLKLEKIKDDFRQQFANNKASSNTKPETALISKAGKPRTNKNIKGDCRHCGKKGHKSNDCWERSENRAKRPPNWKSTKSQSTETANVTTNKRTTYHCTYCDKDGHTEDICYKKKRKDNTDERPSKKKKQDSDERHPKAELSLCVFETALIAAAQSSGILQDVTFIADSGASSHMVYSDLHLFDIEPIDTMVTVGNNSSMPCTSKGTYRGVSTNPDGSTVLITLYDVLYVPQLKVNLLSITKCMSNPSVTLFGSSTSLALQFGQHTLIFGKELLHGSGKLYATDIVPNPPSETTHLTLTYNAYHSMLGNPNSHVVCHTAKHHNVTLTNIHNRPCRHCLEAKLRMKNIPKDSSSRATAPGQRLFFDVSHIKTASFAANHFWLLVMDEYTNFLRSFFLTNKSHISSTLLPFLRQLQQQRDLTVQYLRCDNAPEHIKFQKSLQQTTDLKIKFEYTAPDTPQQNGKIERNFATLYGKPRAMMNQAEFTWTLRHCMWAFCTFYATHLENILIQPHQSTTPYESFQGTLPPWLPYIQPFGSMAIVKHTIDIQSKLHNHGIPAIYLGPALDHADNVYIFWKPKTKAQFCSQNAVFLPDTFSEYYKIPPENIAKIYITDDNSYDSDSESSPTEWESSDEIIDPSEDLFPDTTAYYDTSDSPPSDASVSSQSDTDDDDLLFPVDDPVEPLPVPVIHRFSGIPRELRNLQTSYNPTPAQHWESKHLQEAAVYTTSEPPTKRVHFAPDAVAHIATVYDGSPEPKTYRESLQCPDAANWWVAICTEFANMEQKGVWEIRPKTTVPKGRKIIGARWVFARKDDGRYRARCVSKGFTQIPGKDFQENHAPVVSDTTIHLILAIKILNKLSAGQFDIETAFLYGHLDEELWMELPKGYSRFRKEQHKEDIDRT
jgi:Reverse transcriptase (RNA-dependent DNA polymerase)